MLPACQASPAVSHAIGIGTEWKKRVSAFPGDDSFYPAIRQEYAQIEGRSCCSGRIVGHPENAPGGSR